MDTTTANGDDFRKFIETEVLRIIKDLADKKETANERIQAIARVTLEHIKPGMSIEALYAEAVKLDDFYTELSPLVFKLMKEYEDKYEKKAISQVSDMIKQGNYDGAEEMVKKVLLFKIN